MNDNFVNLREKYRTFSYNGYSLTKDDEFIRIQFDFSIDGLCEFHPTTKIATGNLNIINSFDSLTAQRIIFSLGMVEAVSYWKSSCAPTMLVKCGRLDADDAEWWKKLYYNGLGEFFYRNSIETSFEDFVEIKCVSDCEKGEATDFVSSSMNIIPVGGGKDSNVTMNLLGELHDKNMCFTVNNQGARTDSASAAGYGENEIIKTFRTIDANLLELNKQGFLNGHTPFSAIVAFLSLYCAYLIGAENIVLSNEASANESNISGTDVNHQYSKSYEFERDFNDYVNRHFDINTKYFSILRAFNELQIAKYFSSCKQFHSVFKSCNAGSKKNVWCCNCAKCLFVYIILSPFLTEEELVRIFGCNMLEKADLTDDFTGLTGLSEVKPFECIGTVKEVCCAVDMTVKKYRGESKNLPYLLKLYCEQKGEGVPCDRELLTEFNEENNIPEKFMKYVTEMYNYVSAVD